MRIDLMKRKCSVIVIVCILLSILVGATIAYADGTNYLSVGRYVYSYYHSFTYLDKTIAWTVYRDIEMNSGRSQVQLYSTRNKGSSITSSGVCYGAIEIFDSNSYYWSAITSFNGILVRNNDVTRYDYRYMSGFTASNDYFVCRQRFIVDLTPLTSDIHIYNVQ